MAKRVQAARMLFLSGLALALVLAPALIAAPVQAADMTAQNGSGPSSPPIIQPRTPMPGTPGLDLRYRPDAVPDPGAVRAGGVPGVPDANTTMTEAERAQALADAVARQSHRDERFLTIYSGDTSSGTFRMAVALCNSLRAHFKTHRIRCAALRSSGDAANVQLMRHGRAELAIVSGPTAYYAGLAAFSSAGTVAVPPDVPDSMLTISAMPPARALFALQMEAAVLVTRDEDADISGIPDLRSMTVNLGPMGSTAHVGWHQMLGLYGMTPGDLGGTVRAAEGLSAHALCEGDIDVFAAWSDHPTPLVEHTARRCNIRVHGQWDDVIAHMVARTPYYEQVVLPPNTYALPPPSPVEGARVGILGRLDWLLGHVYDETPVPPQPQPLKTFGSRAVLVTHEAVDDAMIDAFLRHVFSSLHMLQASHPTLSNLSPCQMVQDAAAMPFHPAAVAFYQEQGWMDADGHVTCPPDAAVPPS